MQIKFNAWHYADANLWASITAEFFDQLRAGGYHEGRGRPLTGVVAEVASRVAEAQAAVARSDLRVKELDTQIAHARDDVANAEAKLCALPANMLAAQAATALKRFCSEHRDALDRAGKAIGQESLSENLDALLREAQAASSVRGKLTIFARSLRSLSPRNIVFYLGTIVFLGGVWALQHFSVNGIDWILATGAPALAGLVAVVLALGRSWLVIRPLFEAAAKAADDLASRENELRAERDAGRRKLEQLQAQVDAVTEARKESADFAARYAVGASGASPSTLLRYFLFESEETRAYEQHLGLVSRVRRAFETLNELMREKTDDDAPDRIDRIVLYIDDLDRCRDEQVVQVLEAVHLLLAFDLFVVVVGVDVRWLKGSLGRFYKSQLAENDGDKSDGQASVDEYLGKIFQIPFWLRPLSFGGDGAEGSYEKLLANVLGSRAQPDVRRPPPPDPEPGDESDWKDAQVPSADFRSKRGAGGRNRAGRWN